MANFLATVESGISSQPDPAPAPVPETNTETEQETSEENEAEPDISEETGQETDEETEPEPDSEEDSEAEQEDSEAEQETEPKVAAGAAIDPKAEYQVGDEKIKGEEILKGMLRQADYTRKTQALAEERKGFTDKVESLQEENEEIKDWAKGLSDPDDMRLELERYYPKAFAALRDNLIDEAIALHDMSDRERQLYEENRISKLQQKAQAKDNGILKKRQERKEIAQKTNDLAKSFSEWTVQALKETGLNTENTKHMDLVRARVFTAHRGQTWTKETFFAAAKHVADAIGIKAPKPKVSVAAKPAAPKAKLPPVRPLGAKAPPKGKDGKFQAQKKTPTKDTGNFFENLRRQNGLAI